MKHLLKTMLVAVALVCFGFTQMNAQQMPPIPVDKEVRIGKLENGLTYYIRHNNLPQNADWALCPGAKARVSSLVLT